MACGDGHTGQDGSEGVGVCPTAPRPISKFPCGGAGIQTCAFPKVGWLRRLWQTDRSRGLPISLRRVPRYKRAHINGCVT